MTKIEKEYQKYLDALNRIESFGWTYNIYTTNLRILMNSESTTDFLRRYNLIQESGMNTIDLTEHIFNGKYRGEFSLEELILAAIDITTEYVLDELEYIKEEIDNS